LFKVGELLTITSFGISFSPFSKYCSIAIQLFDQFKQWRFKKSNSG